jgi:hypothetical protein
MRCSSALLYTPNGMRWVPGVGQTGAGGGGAALML